MFLIIGVGAPGSAGALLFLVSALGDILGRVETDWDWPKVLGRSSSTPDAEDKPLDCESVFWITFSS